MKKTLLILLAATVVATNAMAWIENPTQGEYREFSGPGDVPSAEGEPLIENPIEGEYREFTTPGLDLDAWIHGMLWVLRV